MTIYQSDPEAAPDTDFEPGTLHHLVIGNSGRLLDARRTPVTIVGLDVLVGFVTMRLDAFEDAGSTWDVPFEEFGHYQFDRDGRRADAAAVDRFRDAIDRLDRPLVIEADADARRECEERISAEVVESDAWLIAESRSLASRRPLPDPGTRRGDELIAADLEAFMRDRDLWQIEEVGHYQATRVLVRAAVPVDRVFMTYLETAAMNRHFLEAEAVLLAQPVDATGLGM